MEPYKNEFDFGQEFTSHNGELRRVDTLGVESSAVLVLPDGSSVETLEYELEAVRQAQWSEYTPVSGCSGQYGYSGPVMPVSEYFGGGIVDYCLERPESVFVMVYLDYVEHYWDECPSPDNCVDCIDPMPMGWLLLERDRDEHDTVSEDY